MSAYFLLVEKNSSRLFLIFLLEPLYRSSFQETIDLRPLFYVNIFLSRSFARAHLTKWQIITNDENMLLNSKFFN